MKFFLNSIVKLAIINFLLLVFVSVLISGQKTQNPTQATSGALKEQTMDNLSPSPSNVLGKNVSVTLAPVKDVFAELSLHNTKSDCWIGYRGHIYNITPVFGTHPGGDAVMLKDCGADATSSFDSKGKNPPMPHSANAESLLQQYLIQ